MKTVRPYELLVRWKDGAFSGASFRTITTITDDDTGELYVAREDDPQPLSVEDLSAKLDQAMADAQAAADVQAAAGVAELALANQA